jgi:GT2 family glycosyltransferase
MRHVLQSLLAQGCLPTEVVVIDASLDGKSQVVVEEARTSFPRECELKWIAAVRRGAAAQRNQGCAIATQRVLWFFDDDVLFEPDCLEMLWEALESSARMGGVNAIIENQRYHPPGRASALLFAIMNGKREASYAGRVLGPAINVLPDASEAVPEIARVEWLNTGCTLYRREALPVPPFESVFTGYSMMEDLALSLRVAREWDLATVRRARVVHDSQPAAYKSDEGLLAEMELVNRHYVMTSVLGRRRMSDALRLMLWETFQLLVGAINHRLGRTFWKILRGKVRATRRLFTTSSKQGTVGNGQP